MTPGGPMEPRCVFCGKQKELREMDGVWLCPGPHEAIALDQLAALRNARDHWQGEATQFKRLAASMQRELDVCGKAMQDKDAAIESLESALLAARQERDALRDALTHVADEINAQRKGALGREGYETRRYWAQVEGVARDALAAALAATPDDTATQEQR